jgi:hypothetical protein
MERLEQPISGTTKRNLVEILARWHQLRPIVTENHTRGKVYSELLRFGRLKMLVVAS